MVWKDLVSIILMYGKPIGIDKTTNSGKSIRSPSPLNCYPSSWVWQPAADSKGSLANFFLKFEHAGWGVDCGSPQLTIMAVWRPSNKKSLQAFFIWSLQWPVAPDQITHQNSLQNGRRALKAVKTLSGPISMPILDLGFFLKSQCHHKVREGGCKEIQVKLF